MAQLNNDWQALSQFRANLGKVVEELQECLHSTDDAFDTAHQTWNDVQFDKTQNGFDDDKKDLQPLFEAIEELKEDPLKQLQEAINTYTEL